MSDIIDKDTIARRVCGDKKMPSRQSVDVFAPINIALIKYWGKRDVTAMLPYSSNLSITSCKFGTNTKISISNENVLVLNSIVIDKESNVYNKVFDYLSLFTLPDTYLKVESYNNIPTSAGLASSASAFAALAIGVSELFDLNLTLERLSILARLGSISAARSVYNQFTLLKKGYDDKYGLDCYATKVDHSVKDFCIGFCIISDKKKAISSRDCMQHTVKNSVLYPFWPQLAESDVSKMLYYLKNGDFYNIGMLAEQNALIMHATIAMLYDSKMNYLNEQSLKIIQRVQAIRKGGLNVFCTMDAGANVKLLFESDNLQEVQSLFPEMTLCERVI